jgi:hypothetical protein
VENFEEPLVFLLGEFGRSAFSWFVIDILLKRFVGEPFESGEPL